MTDYPKMVGQWLFWLLYILFMEENVKIKPSLLFNFPFGKGFINFEKMCSVKEEIQ